MAVGLRNLAGAIGVSTLLGYIAYKEDQKRGSAEDRIYRKLQGYPQKDLAKLQNPDDAYLSAVEKTDCMALWPKDGNFGEFKRCEGLKSDLSRHNLQRLQKRSEEVAALSGPLERIVALKAMDSEAMDQFAVSAERVYRLVMTAQYEAKIRDSAGEALDIASDSKELVEQTQYHLGRETYQFVKVEKGSVAAIADALNMSPERKAEFIAQMGEAMNGPSFGMSPGME
jgi:hypothetical protein